jgi:CheY-specific phosphatase CheX
MNNYERYTRILARSVDHIFKHFLYDNDIKEVFTNQSTPNDPRVTIQLDGTMKGELIINFPEQTLHQLTKNFFINAKGNIKKYYPDVAGEVANLIAGTFINQLQFIKHNLKPSPPEYNEEHTTLKTLYQNINLSFESRFGSFDLDFYYKDLLHQ